MRHEFEILASQAVVAEVSRGDESAAEKRLALIDGISLLDITQDVEDLASHLVARGPLPTKAMDDAIHLAIAAVHGVDFLLTWNCRHLANAALAGLLGTLISEKGYQPPAVCTPDELMEPFNV